MTNRRAWGVLSLLLALVASTAAYAQTFSVLYDFGQNNGDPFNPIYSGIFAQGRDGNLYGTVPFGGQFSGGAMIKVTPAGKLSVVYSFDGSVGFAPFGGLTLGSDGNFYGTCGGGGVPMLGTVFKITPAGVPTLLYTFTGFDDGSVPYAPPIEGRDGNFYGTTEIGGTFHAGTIYKITRAGALTTIHSFDNVHGAQPIGPLVLGTDGAFYGTTVSGGPANAGTVFKITASGQFTVLHYFHGPDGFDPSSLLVQGKDGAFYGTGYSGGAQGTGNVFRITAGGKFAVLHDFNGSTDGGNPYAGLTLGSDGNFYGVNSFNGDSANHGTLFQIKPKGDFKVLYTFDGTTGATPEVTMVQHTKGILFGDATFGGAFGNGTFYRLSTGLRPFVGLVNNSGRVGKQIQIVGQGFRETTSVTVNGTAAQFKVVSDTFLTATVPSGATSGFIAVTAPGRVLSSKQIFTVF
jgi:uncharacterized repeat protein (TIGR03803 family)